MSHVRAKDRDNTNDVTSQRHPIVRSAATANPGGYQSERQDFRAAAIPAAAIVGCSKLGKCMTTKPQFVCNDNRDLPGPRLYAAGNWVDN